MDLISNQLLDIKAQFSQVSDGPFVSRLKCIVFDLNKKLFNDSKETKNKKLSKLRPISHFKESPNLVRTI